MEADGAGWSHTHSRLLEIEGRGSDFREQRNGTLKAPGTVVYLDLTERKNLNTFKVTVRLPQVPSPSSLSTRLFLRTVFSVPGFQVRLAKSWLLFHFVPQFWERPGDAQGWEAHKGLSAFWPLQQAPEAGRLTNHRHPLLTVLVYPLSTASTGE